MPLLVWGLFSRRKFLTRRHSQKSAKLTFAQLDRHPKCALPLLFSIIFVSIPSLLHGVSVSRFLVSLIQSCSFFPCAQRSKETLGLPSRRFFFLVLQPTRLRAATQVGFSRLTEWCQHCCWLAHRFDKPAMHAALLMSQQGRLQLHTSLCRRIWDWLTRAYFWLNSTHAKHSALYEFVFASAVKLIFIIFF